MTRTLMIETNEVRGRSPPPPPPPPDSMAVARRLRGRSGSNVTW